MRIRSFWTSHVYDMLHGPTRSLQRPALVMFRLPAETTLPFLMALQHMPDLLGAFLGVVLVVPAKDAAVLCEAPHLHFPCLLLGELAVGDAVEMRGAALTRDCWWWTDICRHCRKWEWNGGRLRRGDRGQEELCVCRERRNDREM
jgi:hypothetical protein